MCKMPGPLKLFHKFYLLLYYSYCYSDRLAELLVSKAPRDTLTGAVNEPLMSDYSAADPSTLQRLETGSAWDSSASHWSQGRSPPHPHHRQGPYQI